jgi:all-trans-retinol dehydrogenase (NAD+)
VNNLAIFWRAKVFLPAMIKCNHGHFLITASQCAYATAGRIVDYPATKAAAIAIYEGLQTELKHLHNAPGVRVSVISPAVAQTKMFETTKSPSNFILPRLEASDVGQKMCENIWSAKSQEGLIPAAACLTIPWGVMGCSAYHLGFCS